MLRMLGWARLERESAGLLWWSWLQCCCSSRFGALDLLFRAWILLLLSSMKCYFAKICIQIPKNDYKFCSMQSDSQIVINILLNLSFAQPVVLPGTSKTYPIRSTSLIGTCDFLFLTHFNIHCSMLRHHSSSFRSVVLPKMRISGTCSASKMWPLPPERGCPEKDRHRK